MTETVTKSPAEKLPEFIERFKDDVVAIADYRGDLCIDVRKDRLPEMIRFLKETLQFNMLMDLFGMDYAKYGNGLSGVAVIYNLYSMPTRRRVRLRVFLGEERPEIRSICDLFAAANWFEREAFDLFGVTFTSHPNLTRILCHHDFEGHALLKEYPADHYQRLKSAIPSTEI
ncbi:MAG: NADH-quinone oxidoreductase subunit C [Deltaproteobacteria bacterium]|nr:NADH-quinone oxidoreductase subunit C [Deltaproteobacteria bacterium]MBI3296035.1 NADH-quinone oxidoreductase subunit C [Deltaproteobacteria bacterium]